MELTQDLLREEFTRRKLRNSAYSLRAFARDLGIGSTSLSDFLSSKRKLSKTSLGRISEALALSPEQQIAIIAENRKRGPAEDEEKLRLRLMEDEFRLISDWYYFAVLALAEVKKNKATPEWIGERLNIDTKQAEMALERLQRLNLVTVKRGRMVPTTQQISTTREIPSAAIRKHHTDNLRLAEESLHKDAIETREFSSVTMAIDPAKLPLAKDALMKAKRKVSKLLKSEDPKAVYTLSFQLFPLTQNVENEISGRRKSEMGSDSN